MPLTWDIDSEGYYATAIDEAGAMRFRLIVEPVGARWGWTVLGPGASTQHGDADTLQGAMWGAEQAAR
jgi:hypothetical protein